MKSYIVHCYVHNLISNEDGRYDTFGSAWFKVSGSWLETAILKLGFSSINDFFSSYTYDDTEGMLDKAIEDGVLQGCGTGDMTPEE